MPTAISNRQPEVTVEFDGAKGKRVAKHFKDVTRAKQFFAAKDKAKKNPKVIGGKAAKPTTAKSSAKPGLAAFVAGATAKSTFGYRIASQAGQIDVCITSQPQKPADIAAKCKLPSSRVATHLSHLYRKGLIKRTKDGYSAK